MAKRKMSRLCSLVVLICVAALTAGAQSFQVQCPTSTITHPMARPMIGTSVYRPDGSYRSAPMGYMKPASKCKRRDQMPADFGRRRLCDHGRRHADVPFRFRTVSGLADIASGQPGTQPPSIFNGLFPAGGLPVPGDPATTNGATSSPYSVGTLGMFNYNGAIGQVLDADCMAGGLCGGADPAMRASMGTWTRARSWTWA